jgi:hypothetical protein
MQQFGVHERNYANVPANTIQDHDYVVPNGKTLLLMACAADSMEGPDTNVCVAWDIAGTPKIVLTSYADIVQSNLFLRYEGDGSKKMTIRLQNDKSEAVMMGGYFQGELIDT